MTGDDGVGVGGPAEDRTELAWHRSALALAACGLALLRGIGRPPVVTANAAVGIGVSALGAITALLGAWHAQRSRRRPARTTDADVTLVAFGVAVVGIGAFVLAALG